MKDEAKELLELVGGRDNIKSVSHCITRMRFVLVDEKKADTKAIDDLSFVKGTFTQAGQFQVIIGNNVSDFYKDFCEVAGIDTSATKEDVKEAAKSNQTLLQRIMSTLGEIFAPLIPAIICGGLILGLRNIIGEIAFFNGQTLTEISPIWQSIYDWSWVIGEAIFHMLPVGIVWSITKKMGTTQILGIVLGLTLVSPQLLNGFDFANGEAVEFWNFGLYNVAKVGYQGQVLSAMLSGFVLVGLEKFWTKICRPEIRTVFVPFLSLVPAVFIAHAILGEVGRVIGDSIADVVNWGLGTPGVKVGFAAIFGAFYAPLVMTGLHHMTNAIDTQLVSKYNRTILWPMIALSNIAQGSSVLAMSVLQKNNEKAKQVNIPAYITCFLGVTEPALFGVNLKYGFPLICAMIGSSLAAVVCVGLDVGALSIGVGGLPAIISIEPSKYLSFLIAMAISIIVPFTLTYIVGKKKGIK